MDALTAFKQMMKVQVAPAWRQLGMQGSGGSFRVPNEAGHHALMGVQKDKWNTAQRCAFTLNLTFVSAQEWKQERDRSSYLGAAPSANSFVYGVGWTARIGELVRPSQDHWWLIRGQEDVPAVAEELVRVVEQVALPHLHARVQAQSAPASSSWFWTAPSTAEE